MLKSDTGQSTLFLFLEYAFKFSLSFTLTALIARHLGPENSGRMSFVINFASTLIPLYVMGINELSIKDLIQSSERTNIILSTTFIIKLLGGLFASLLMLIAFYFLQIDSDYFSIIILISLFLSFKSFEVIDNWYLAHTKSKAISIARLGTILIISSIKFFFLYANYDWKTFASLSALEPVLYAMTYIYFMKKNNLVISFSLVNSKLAGDYLKKSCGVLTLTLLTALLFRLDQFYVENYFDPTTLGNYLAAVKLIEVVQFAPMIVISVLFSKLVSHHKLSSGRILIRTYYGFILLPTLVFCIITSYLSNPITHIIYGSKFSSANVFLQTYCWSALPLYLLWARMRLSILESKILSEIKVVLLAFVFFFILNTQLKELFQARSAVISICFSLAISNLLFSFYDPYIRQSFLDFLYALNPKYSWNALRKPGLIAQHPNNS